MSTGKAIAIVKNIQSTDFTDKEKALAIYVVMNMPTHMSITKEELINVIEWLWNCSFELENEDAELVGEEE